MKKKAAAPLRARSKPKLEPLRAGARSRAVRRAPPQRRTPPAARPVRPRPVRKSTPPEWLSDKVFREIVESTGDVFSILDSKGNLLYRSPSANSISGSLDVEDRKSNMVGLVIPEDRMAARAVLGEMLKNPGRRIPFQVRVKRINGDPARIEGAGVNVITESGFPVIVLHYQDSTKSRDTAAALEENERRYRDLFDHAALAIFQSAPDGKVIRVNPQFARMFGFDSPEEVRTAVRDVAVDLFTDPARRKEIIRLREKNPELTKFENHYRRKDGSTFWGLMNVHTVADSNGRPQYYEGFIEDISDRKEAERALRESAEMFRSIFDNSSAGVALVDLDGRYLIVNPAFCGILGYSAQELLRTGFLELTHPDDMELSRKAMQDVLAGKGRSVRFAKRYVHKDGHTVYAEVASALVVDSDGKPTHFITHVLDVTDRHRAEAALRENEERYRSLFEGSLEGIGLSRGNRIVDANKALLEIFGYGTLAEFRAIPLLDHVAPESKEDIRRRLTGQRPGDRNRFAYKIIRKDGATRDLEISTDHLTIGGESFTLSTFRDITERKQAEDALRASEERYRLLFELSPDSIAVYTDGIIRYANPATLRLLGANVPEEIIGRSMLDFVHPDYRKMVIERSRQQEKEGQPSPSAEEKFLRLDGRSVDAEVMAAPFEYQGKKSHLVISRDITERRRAEEALRESEDKFKYVFDHSMIGKSLTMPSGEIHVNEALCEMLGYTQAELQGKTWMEISHPDDVKLTQNALDPLLADKKESLRIEKRYLRKDGSVVWADVSTFLRRDGQCKPLYFITSVVDITERKRAEEQLSALAERHGALLSAIPEIVMEVDTRKVYTWANPAGIEFFGPDVLGKGAADFFIENQPTYDVVQPLFAGGEDTIYVESWQRRKDGGKRLLAWWCRNLKNSRGEVIGALSTARDVTEQRQAEEQIQILSRFPTESPNPILRISPRGELLYANPASRPFLDLWGIEAGGTVPEKCRTLAGEAFAADAIQESQMTCGARIFDCTLTPIQGAGYVNVYARDITETKRAQDALARQAEELRQRNAELARLNDLTEHRMRRLVALRAIDTAITSSFKLELVLNILLGQLTDLTGAHAADILIFLPDLQTFRFSCGRGFHGSILQQAYLRKPGSYANQAAQDRRTVKVPLLNEAADAARVYPKIAGEGFKSYLCLPLVAKGQVEGVLEIYQRGSLDLDTENENFLEMVAGQAAIAIDNADMFEGLQATNDELTLAYNDTLAGWARTLELRNREMGGEAQRLADLAVRLARALGTGEAELVPLYRGAVLHDIGMMGIPDSILLKPGPLTDADWEIVRRHPQHAHDLLSTINYLRSAIDIPYCHHEKWDGTGYPRGLAGNQIPLSARIFAVVDVWDALRSNRPYRRAQTDAEARDCIRKLSGTQFDPAVVEAFLEMQNG
jgi:PAS domain S-box-containing protein